MNRIAFTIFPLLMLGLVSSALSQTRAITEAEFNEMIVQSALKISKVSYRQKESTVGYDSNVSTESITEIAPPDRSRRVSVQKDAKGTTRTEVIWIGKVKYSKLNQEEWKQEEVTQSNSMSGGGSGRGAGSGSGSGTSLPDINQSYEYLGTDKVNGIVTDRYESTRTITFNLASGTHVRKNSRSYWYDKDGRIVKAILEDKIGNRLYRVVTEYDYKVILKIVAPIK